jgi:dephospho-CoA kinase
MAVVALTGGIGAGKSTVAQYFASLGATVIDADQLARFAIKPGSSGFAEVEARFGGAVINEGKIDRGALAQIVFNDEKARKDLEAIIHPRVQKLLSDAIADIEDDEILIYEIPLLVETAAASKFDFIITVEADLEIRKSRLLDRGLSQEQIEKRIHSQSSQSEREAVADAVITNNGDEDELLRQVENLWEGALARLSVG